MSNWTSLSVKDATQKIKDSEMVLPVIQRRLVWTEEKMEMLFDTLLKGNSFGSIICIEEAKNTKPLFAFREFSRDGNNVASTEVEDLSKTQWFIIDGQQRLQSFYIGLIGSYNSKHLYFDLYSNYLDDEYDFKFAVNSSELPKNNKERSDSTVTECLWYPVSGLFDRCSETNDDDQVSEEIIKKYEIEDSLNIRYIEKNVRAFYRSVFNAKSIGVSIVSVNKSKDPIENRQRIVELFRRLNDGGTKLSSYDLVASMFKGFDYKMELFLDTVVSENSDIGIDQDILIKLLLILNDKLTKEMAELSVQDAEFATSNYTRIQSTLKALKNFLKASNHYNWFASSKTRSAIPLYFLSYNIFHSNNETSELENMFVHFDTNDKNYSNMAIWLRLSLLNKVFSRGCGWIPYKTGIKKIHTVMLKHKGNIFPHTEIFSTYKWHPLYFYENITPTNLDSFDSEYIFYLLYNGQSSIRTEDIDHIHPKWILTKKGVDEQKINSIGNFQLLDSGTNRGSKNGKELYDWITNCIEESNKSTYLTRHLIPADTNLWDSNQFDVFLDERLKLLSSKINN